MQRILLPVDAFNGSDACVKACARTFSAAPPRNHDHVSEEILNAAMDECVELIITGNSRGPVARLMMGDVVKAVASGAEVPVLAAR